MKDIKFENERAEKISKDELEIAPNGKALIPFLVFIGVYLGSGIILQLKGVEMAFYQFPAPLAVVIGIIAAFLIIKGKFSDKFDTFIKGCGDSNIIIMCIIYLLAGGFASVCKAMGGIDSTVNLGLTYIPPQYLAAGVFVISAFIATATGTSVGSAAAVGPIAIAVAEKSGTSLPLMMGCVLGGIMLGDNLSIISDTTIASTRTQGCDMKDKFKLNLWLTVLPAIITIVLLLLFAARYCSKHRRSSVQYYKSSSIYICFSNGYIWNECFYGTNRRNYFCRGNRYLLWRPKPSNFIPVYI